MATEWKHPRGEGCEEREKLIRQRVYALEAELAELGDESDWTYEQEGRAAGLRAEIAGLRKPYPRISEPQQPVSQQEAWRRQSVPLRGEPATVTRGYGATFGGGTLEENLRANGFAEFRVAARGDRDNLDDGGFRGMHDFLRSLRQTREGRFDSRLEQWQSHNYFLAPQSTIAGQDGGYVVPPRLLNEVFAGVFDAAPFLARRRQFMVLPGQEVNYAALDDANKSAGKIANVGLTRTAENATIPEAQYKLRAGAMKCTKAAALLTISNELMESSVPNQNQIITDLFARLVALTQANDFVNGLGVGEPLGVLVGLDKYQQATTSSANEIDIADVANMAARLEGPTDPSVCWIAHRSVLTVLSAMTVGGTIPSNPVFLPSARSGEPTGLFGYDLFHSEACKTVNTPGDLILCRMAEYIYLFAPLMIDVSYEANFSKDQTVFRLKLRDAGQPLRGSTGRDLQNFETANFVTLATRS